MTWVPEKFIVIDGKALESFMDDEDVMEAVINGNPLNDVAWFFYWLMSLAKDNNRTEGM
jgi:hypothetical protein